MTALKVYKRKPSTRGFTLVEVVVAIGIFAIAIVGVIGLLAPTSKSINQVVDSDDATRVINSIQAELQRVGFTTVQDIVNKQTEVFSTKDGTRIGAESSSVWDSTTSDADKFFVIKLIRNTDLSKAEDDDSAGYLAFTLRIAWPAYTQDPDNPIKMTSAEQLAQQEIMIVPMAITR